MGLMDMSQQSMEPIVGVVMGSASDWRVMEYTVKQLQAFDIPFESKVISAHRTPDVLYDYGHSAASRGLKCIIAGAGGAAHLPGMLAAITMLPVLAVPVPSRYLNGQDSLLSIVQMPKGVPVATFAIGEAGAVNAGLFAVALLAIETPALTARLREFRQNQHDDVLRMTLPSQT